MKELHRKATKRLEHLPNVSGVGFGLKEQDGKRTNQWAWRIYVTQKLPKHLLAPQERAPSQLFGFSTDVIVRKHTLPNRGTRVNPGESIANSKGVPGTLGCLVQKENEETWHLLTNAHVLLGQNASKGDPIWLIDYQPDGSYQCHLIGETDQTEIGVVRYQGVQYFIDGALGRLKSTVQVRHHFPNKRWEVIGSRFPNIGEKVTKIGAGSGLTSGIVADICYPDVAYIGRKSFVAPNQILISPLTFGDSFCKAGDSGAIVLDESNKVIGLLWGNNAKGEGIACHIAPVLQALEIKIEKPGLNFLQKIWQRLMDQFHESVKSSTYAS